MFYRIKLSSFPNPIILVSSLVKQMIVIKSMASFASADSVIFQNSIYTFKSIFNNLVTGDKIFWMKLSSKSTNITKKLNEKVNFLSEKENVVIIYILNLNISI